MLRWAPLPVNPVHLHRAPGGQAPQDSNKKTICEHGVLQLSCKGGYINVLSATYGRVAGREVRQLLIDSVCVCVWRACVRGGGGGGGQAPQDSQQEDHLWARCPAAQL